MAAKTPKTAKLFRNGNSQAVRLPKEYRFPGKEVVIQSWGKGALLLPPDDVWRPLLESLDQFSPDFMLERNQPSMQKRENLFP